MCLLDLYEAKSRNHRVSRFLALNSSQNTDLQSKDPSILTAILLKKPSSMHPKKDTGHVEELWVKSSLLLHNSVSRSISKQTLSKQETLRCCSILVIIMPGCRECQGRYFTMKAAYGAWIGVPAYCGSHGLYIRRVKSRASRLRWRSAGGGVFETTLSS